MLQELGDCTHTYGSERALRCVRYEKVKIQLLTTPSLRSRLGHTTHTQQSNVTIITTYIIVAYD